MIGVFSKKRYMPFDQQEERDEEPKLSSAVDGMNYWILAQPQARRDRDLPKVAYTLVPFFYSYVSREAIFLHGISSLSKKSICTRTAPGRDVDS